jgi:hypothetical protein
VQKSSTFFPQDFHRISTYKNTRKAFSDKGCLEFSTILAFPNFLNFYVDKYISLTFIYFCLDKGVHFSSESFELFKPLEFEGFKFRVAQLRSNSQGFYV